MPDLKWRNNKDNAIKHNNAGLCMLPQPVELPMTSELVNGTNTDDLETRQQRLVDRTLMTSTTRQESVTSTWTNTADNEDHSPHRLFLLTFKVPIDVRVNAGWQWERTMVLFYISELIKSPPLILRQSGWLYEWWTVVCLDKMFWMCVALLLLCRFFSPNCFWSKGSAHFT